MIRLWLFLLFAAWAGSVHAAEAARIAVISDQGGEDLAALVTAKLSNHPGVILPERDALAKIGDEQTLVEMAAKSGDTLGKLLHADGLLFISRNGEDTEIRFSAVQLGIVLFDLKFPRESDVSLLPFSLLSQIENDIPKLGLPPGKAIPLTVLNLHADYAVPSTAASERRLTLLLENNLAAVPQIMILERRHGEALGFEKALDPDSTAPLAGACLLDGTLAMPVSPEGDIVARMRLRLPDLEREIDVEAHGPAADLRKTAEAMASAVVEALRLPSPPAPGSSMPEARVYLAEALWAMRHGTPQEAREALDDAELLAAPEPDLIAAQISFYCDDASRGVPPTYVGPAPGQTPADGRSEERADEMTRALAGLKRYRSEGMESRREVLLSSNEYTAEALQGKAFNAGIRLLWLLDRIAPERGIALRASVHALAPFDVAAGRIPDLWTTPMNYLDDWVESADEEMDILRTECERVPEFGYEGDTVSWLTTFGDPERFCPRFFPAPDNRQTRYLQFIENLESNPISKPIALLFLARWIDPASQDRYHAFLAELWDEKEVLIKSRRMSGLLGWACKLAMEHSPADPLLCSLLHYYFRNETESKWGQIMATTWEPKLFPKSEASAFWDDLQEMRKRIPGWSSYFDSMEASYIAVFGDPRATLHPFLRVHRFWDPGTIPGNSSFAPFQIAAMKSRPDGLWVFGSHQDQAVVYRVDLKHFTAERLADPSLGVITQAVVSDGFVYIVSHSLVPPKETQGSSDHPFYLARYEAETGTWRQRTIPSGVLYAAGKGLYVSHFGRSGGLDGGPGESTLLRYDWESDTLKVLVSARRTPPLNQFDGHLEDGTIKVFPWAGGDACAMIGSKIYRIREESGEWSQIETPGYWYPAPFDDGFFEGNLGASSSPVLVHIDSDQPAPEIFIGPALSTEDAKRLPAWTSNPMWTGIPELGRAARHEGDVFILKEPGISYHTFTLFWYRSGVSQPIRIPLSFQADAAIEAHLKSIGDFTWSLHPEKEGPQLNLTATEEGLCLDRYRDGFWFIPYADLEAYATKDGQSQAKAGSVVQIPQ